MFLDLRQLLLGLHIFLAMFWVGGILFIGWGVFPTTQTLSLSNQRQFLISLMRWTHYVFTLAGTGVIITGILLGTVVGPIQNWHVLWNTAYGNIWLAALIIGTITLFWGIFIGYKQMMKVFLNDSLWQLAAEGDRKPLNSALVKVAAVESVEVLGFITLIILMISLR